MFRFKSKFDIRIYASFEDFTILLKENNKFKLHLKESLLIKRDKPELNKNIYSYRLGAF